MDAFVIIFGIPLVVLVVGGMIGRWLFRDEGPCMTRDEYDARMAAAREAIEAGRRT